MQHKTILIVEDSEFDRQLLAKVVEKLGFQTMLCNDGDEAIIALKSQKTPIDLILLDIHMPNVDGISVLGHCSNHHPDIPVVVVSASQDEDDKKSVMKWGAKSFVHKPITVENISDAIQQALKK